MDRIIEVKVGGNHLSKDGKNAGVRGEANVTKLRITFDEGWEGFTKKITFWNARGLNPVVIDLLPSLAESSLVYLVPIPAEPMEMAGELTFVIEGTVNDKVQRSLEDKLEVKDASIAPNAGQPVPPTENELTQLSGEIEKIKGDILEVRSVKEETIELKNETALFAGRALDSYHDSYREAERAKVFADDAQGNAERAEATLGKTSYIGENGNWFAWDSHTSAFYDTGVKAQAGSTVYCGDNPPPEASVWIDPEGGADALADCANAIKGTASGTVVQLNDISPLQETIKVKVSGVDDPSSVTVTRCGKSLFDLSDLDINYKWHYVGFNFRYIDARPFRGKRLIYQREVDFTNTIEDTACFSIKIIYYDENKNIIQQMFGPNISKTSNSKLCSLKADVTDNVVYMGFCTTVIFDGGTGAPVEGSTMRVFNSMVEIGNTMTDYEPYNGETFTPNADGTLYIPSQSPVMTLYTDTYGANIECEYNRDSNKVIEKLTNAIISLGGNV